MPLTVLSFAVHLVIGMAVWISELSVGVKMLITVLLAAKILLGVYSSLVAEPDLARNIGLSVCGLLDLVGAFYMATTGIWTAFVGFITLFVLMVGWRVLPTVNFLRKAGR